MRIDPWTAERIADLTRLWRDGLTAKQIAARLGQVTRNAVIGKVHRLGLVRGAAVKAIKLGPPPRKHAKRPPTAYARRDTDKLPPPPDAKTAKTDITPDLGAMAAGFGGFGGFGGFDERQDAPRVFVPGPVGVFDVQWSHCRWPLNDPLAGADFRYCGQEKMRGSYCAAHARVAYVPPRTKAQAAADRAAQMRRRAA